MTDARSWGLLAAVLLLLVPGPVRAGEGPASDRLDRAIERGRVWIEAHPAGLEHGGPRDLIDEALLYLVLRGMTQDSGERERLGDAARERLARLQGSPEFSEWVQAPGKTLLDHYHLVLAAHLMRGLGIPTTRQDEIAARAKRALAAAPRAPPSLRLTLAVFLGYLGEAPPVAGAQLLAESLIARVTAAPRALPLPAAASGVQRGSIGIALYALVHEVLALTDFGRRPAPPWLERRRDALGAFLTRAARWAGGGDNFDLLAELLVTRHLLGLPLHGVLDREVAVLTTAQRPDGTWGACSPSRQDPERHAVLTSVAALRAYRQERGSDRDAAGPR